MTIRPPLRLLATGLLLGAAAPAIVAAPPTVAERYALADRYLHTDRLVPDLDLAARFVSRGDGIVLRRGVPGDMTIRFVAAGTKTETALVDDQTLAQQIAVILGHPVDAVSLNLRPLDYDPARGTLRFAAADAVWQRDRDGALTREPGLPPGPLDDPLLGGAHDATSPDGRYKIRTEAGNLVAIDTRTGRSVALTTDGTLDDPYGQMAAPLKAILDQNTEHPAMPVIAEWSPDSRRILTFRLDTDGVQRWSMTQENAPGSRFPRSFHYVYPSAGAPVLPTMRRVLFDVPAAFAAGPGVATPVSVPPEQVLYPEAPEDSWAGDRPRIPWTERGYGSLAVYSVDPATGKATIVARETGKPLVTVTATAMQAAPELGGELVISERSGWAQLYLVKPSDPNGGQALTTGSWEVTGIAHVDAAAHAILVTGVGREPDRNTYFSALYRVPTDGGAPVLLTPEPLDHDTTVSADGRWFIDSMSSPTVPTRTLLRDARDGHVVMELGHADPAPLLRTGFTPPEPFSALADDHHTRLYGMIFRPAHADPHRHYPVIDNVYAGPTTTNVPVSYAETVHSSAESLAQIGAIVVRIDGRGTSLRGKAFRLPAYQNLGNVGLDDHVEMLRAMAAQDPSFDLTHLGVWGHSAGGFDAARFILRRPDVFSVAVAGDGIHDLRLDKAWWPEVSMGDASPEVWDRNSNIDIAGQLRGKLLLMHGDVDDNVPVTASFHLQKALIDAGKDVDFTIVPNKRHDIYGPYAWRQLRDYFLLYLLREMPSSNPQLGSNWRQGAAGE